jgi:archaellum component FlaC
MKNKKTIIDKTCYGGMMVDKYFLHFDDGTDEQISPEEWDQYKVGEKYPKEESLEAVDKICKQIEEVYRENEYKDKIIKDLREELNRCFRDIKLFSKVNVSLRKEIRQLETLLELNMKDFWDVCDQRDWYYEEYQKLKEKM